MVVAPTDLAARPLRSTRKTQMTSGTMVESSSLMRRSLTLWRKREEEGARKSKENGVKEEGLAGHVVKEKVGVSGGRDRTCMLK